MKVLFLDIDGVINSFDNQFAMQSLQADTKKKSKDQYGILFDNRCVFWLEHIVSKTSCRFVISSAWRLSGLHIMKEMWKHRALPGEIIDIRPIKVPVEIFSKYNSDIAIRGYEIQAWLDKNKVSNYCIVDDDSDMLPHQNFVKTNGRIGLNYETSKSIIETLNNY